MIEQLVEWEYQAEQSLDTANEASSPNEERVDKLENRLGLLSDAKSALEEIE